MDKIYYYLKNEVFKKLQTAFPLELTYKEGVMKSFFNILNSHELMCYNFEKNRINNYISNERPLPKTYVDYNRLLSNKKINLSSLYYMMSNIEYVDNIFCKLDIYTFDNSILNILKNIHTCTPLEAKSQLSKIKEIIENTNSRKLDKQLDYSN